MSNIAHYVCMRENDDKPPSWNYRQETDVRESQDMIR
jgi:hypothetical protein